MSSALRRKSYFVDERAIREAKRALGVDTDAEVIRIAVERLGEMERFWKFMQASQKKLKRGAFERP
jgi:hypothetical protein